MSQEGGWYGGVGGGVSISQEGGGGVGSINGF